MRTNWLIVSLLLLGWLRVDSQNLLSFARTDSVIDRITAFDKGMGSVSVHKNGVELYRRHYGYSSLETQQPIDDATLFRIGSISKVFTATLIFKQIELGKLRLSDPLSNWFPLFGNARKITIRHLLSHQSGIYNFTNDANILKWNTLPHSRKELLDRMLRYPNVFMPGDKTEYSNSNYVLLSWILEDVTGKPYAQLLNQYILKPVGLKQTFFTTDSLMPLAKSYSMLNTWTKASESHQSIPLGAGAIVSTPPELNRFIAALFTGKLLNDSTLKTMKTTSGYLALGLMKAPFHERTAWGHTGSIDSFQAQLFYFQDDSLAVAITSNAIVYSLNELMIAILSEVYHRPFELPVFKNALETNVEQLKAYVGVYSATGLPLKLTISIKDSLLIGQGTGQPAFPLIRTGPHQFSFEQAGIVLEFVPSKKQMLLIQMGNRFLMTKE